MLADNRRIIVQHCRPVVDFGRFNAKATVGVPFEVSADAFTDGHTNLLVWARFGRAVPSTALGSKPAGWNEIELRPGYDDRWYGRFVPDEAGAMAFDVVACTDDWGSLLHDMNAKFRAQDKVEVELEEAAVMAEQRLRRGGLRAHDRRAIEAVVKGLRGSRSQSGKVALAGRRTTVDVMRATVDRSAGTLAGPFPIWVDRTAGGFSAWYEMFPRSEGAEGTSSGTFVSAAKRLPDIASMGFDIVYLPPIHPIGEAFRKGPNNSLAAGPGDPGSPWAIGAKSGGHTDVHPDLGTIWDFDAFVLEARRLGLEVGLDFAAQCSPDHPWVKQHPEWFAHRPDGSIKYAENPPKKYQDIYPVNFATRDWRRLWHALRDVMLYWCRHDVRVFRVDNPHTKSFNFWEWAISEVRRRHPETIFLSEAFTRPRVMEYLAKIGFTQSYTYFTWRNSKDEIETYLKQLSQPPLVDYFRPNFWPNTPDILHEYLQHGGPAAFRTRLVLGALCSPNWGMYSGYELFENVPIREGSEEYDHSEKFELRPRDWGRPDSLAPMISAVNAIRKSFSAAVASLPTLRVQGIDNGQMVCVSRMSWDRGERLLIIVNLDPFNAQEATTTLDLADLKLPTDEPYEAHDLLTGTTYVWHGPYNYVRLDPSQQSAHILHLRRR